MGDIRLDMFVSKALGVSRKEAKEIITGKKIMKDGLILNCPKDKIGEDATIEFEGKTFSYKKYVYIVQNKPLGIVSSTDDSDGKTVIDILPEELKRRGLFPAGRLDKYSRGMMIITDDGNFAHRILAPVSHIEKEYFVKVKEEIVDEKLKEKFAEGVYLGEGKYSSPAQMEIIDSCTAKVVIHEGIYHQVRRMFKENGGEVCDLKRIRMGGLFLPCDLKEGESRLLGEEEKEKLLFRK